MRQYTSSFYSAILLLTANDLGPVGRVQTALVVFGILMGAIYNANIFGNMALLISEMNKKIEAFESVINTSNTAMKHLKLPPATHSKIIAYLNYISDSKDRQNELKTFLESISPSLMSEVVFFIFAQALSKNRMLRYCRSFNE